MRRLLLWFLRKEMSRHLIDKHDIHDCVWCYMTPDMRGEFFDRNFYR